LLRVALFLSYFSLSYVMLRASQRSRDVLHFDSGGTVIALVVVTLGFVSPTTGRCGPPPHIGPARNRHRARVNQRCVDIGVVRPGETQIAYASTSPQRRWHPVLRQMHW